MKAQPATDFASVNGTLFGGFEKEAEYPGGLKRWTSYLEKAVDKRVPEKNKAPKGKYVVIVKFLVGKNGEISNVCAQTRKGFGMEEEAIRVIKRSKRWIPAMHGGIKMISWHFQPITFQVL